MSEIHCDRYIHNRKFPICLRYFLFFNRLPSMDKGLVREVTGKEPKCFAMWGKKRVRLVMASRMGDVGITTSLKHSSGYDIRVFLSELSDFSPEV